MKNTNKALIIFAALLTITSALHPTLTPEQEAQAITMFHKEINEAFYSRNSNVSTIVCAVDKLPVITSKNPFIVTINEDGDTINLLWCFTNEATKIDGELLIQKMLRHLGTKQLQAEAILACSSTMYNTLTNLRDTTTIEFFRNCLQSYITERLKSKTEIDMEVELQQMALNPLSKHDGRAQLDKDIDNAAAIFMAYLGRKLSNPNQKSLVIIKAGHFNNLESKQLTFKILGLPRHSPPFELSIEPEPTDQQEV